MRLSCPLCLKSESSTSVSSSRVRRSRPPPQSPPPSPAPASPPVSWGYRHGKDSSSLPKPN
uniref:Uncharacterized protein n=1 Tax=Anguilla anguilla TaxID=7936 RepID=A0A0E9UIY8_ANGAN